MSIEHKDAFRLGYELVRLYAIDTFGSEKEWEYKLQLIKINTLLQSTNLVEIKPLLRPTPERDQSRASDGSLYEEYETIFYGARGILETGRSRYISNAFILGWHLVSAAVALANPLAFDKQGAEQTKQTLKNVSSHIRDCLNGAQLPHSLVRKLDDLADRIETTTNRSSEANKIREEIFLLYDHLASVFEQFNEPPVFQPQVYQVNTQIVRVLFISADPTDTCRLRLGEEFREIRERLKSAQLRERFILELPQMSVRPADISQSLLDIQPQIVHFSGHGNFMGALCFEDQTGQTKLVQPDALAALFEHFTSQVNCVLLNACYSEIQAKAIAEHIEYVIGMNKAIGDEAAIAFDIGFYQALGAGCTVEEAYKLGCVQIRLQGISEHLTPVLIKKGQQGTA